jgi:acyl carrier protein
MDVWFLRNLKIEKIILKLYKITTKIIYEFVTIIFKIQKINLPKNCKLDINMNKQEIIEELKAIVKPYIQNQEAFDTLTEETDFINDLKINSANLVDVILDIEEKYNIVIDNESMERMVNVKAAMTIIETQLAAKK